MNSEFQTLKLVQLSIEKFSFHKPEIMTLQLSSSLSVFRDCSKWFADCRIRLNRDRLSNCLNARQILGTESDRTGTLFTLSLNFTRVILSDTQLSVIAMSAVIIFSKKS